MSKIEKLLIRGIRSFNPDVYSEDNVISFLTPLTLIVGPNGSGKTTIIECLKYATTGDLPPNSKGGAFIHDPKIANETEIKAQIKLKFSNLSGTHLVATRSIQSTQKKNSITQKTLESVLMYKDSVTGEQKSISSRCAELDTEIPIQLGVSKAILENVIFCHQEESNWPLSEPSILKKKFDDIFASTKYTKVIDNIKSIRKEQSINIKLESQKISFLEKDKFKAESLRTAQIVARNKVNNIKERLSDLERNEIDEVSEEIDRIEETLQEIGQLQYLLKQNTLEKNIADKNMEELSAKIKIYTESDDELNELIKKYSEEIKNSSQNNNTYKYQLDTANKRQKFLESQQINELTKKGRYQAEIESYETIKKKRNNLINNLRTKYEFLDQQKQMNQIFNAMNSENALLNQDLHSFEELSRKKENDINEKINGFKSKLFINKENQKNDKSKYSSNKLKYDEYYMKLKSNEISKQEIDDLIKTIKEKENVVKEEQIQFDNMDYLAQITMKEKESEKIKESYRAIVDEISKIHANSKLQVQYSLIKEKLKEKESSKNEIIKEYKKKMQEIYNEIYEENEIKNINSNYKTNLSNEKKNIKDDIERTKNQLASTKTRLSISESSYQKSLTELEKSNEKISQICGEEDLKEMLKETEKVLMEKQDVLANISSAKIMYTKFIAKSKKSHCCPLCIKKFENSEENKFIERLEKIIQKIPETIEKAKIRVEEELKKREKLRSLEPLYLKIESLKNKELKKLKEDIDKYKKEEEVLNDNLSKLNEKLNQLSIKENQFKEFEEICQKREKILKEYHTIEIEINELKNDVNNIGTHKDLKELQKDQQFFQNKSDELQKQINNMHNQYSQALMQLQESKNMLLKLNEKLTYLKNRLNEYEFIKISMDNLLKDNEKFEQDIKKLEIEEKEIEDKIVIAEEELAFIKKANEQERFKKEAKIKEIKESIDQLNNINDEIKKYQNKNIENLLQESEQELEKIDKELKECHTKILEISNVLSQQNEHLLKIEVLKREVEDNIQYRSIQQNLHNLNKKKVELESKISQYDIETYNDNLIMLNEKKKELLNEKATITGELKQLEDRVRQIERELTTEYKNVDEDYIKSQLKLKTDEMAYEDLEKYSKALDNAIMHYHSIKMEEINRTIQELWVQTYQGSDIDTIEIRGEKELSKSKVKSYNYRVVMLKDGKEINMRGRCSSGQKVLASLIIRLALAESFCINCGILALDEPTTNLDQANIESLAESLTMYCLNN
ncbi:hypothetical protein BCR36DRAFT_165343 [Piromyces finnis]|uniref:DNA repair protein RAD50 n=1 Tax=Piromyces finnis TaxID=1754191 RepID=A0A1Y1VI00_9FUNG|nr:hypothetical protein BCR36DRAFT_165343 [Piromyces finnis]|eukprot:ORX56659.1 hypothetical protein BCR36DRAFT_165343 [Piromyces finnis]